jgi:indole-3-glycerol phosphate synthase
VLGELVEAAAVRVAAARSERESLLAALAARPAAPSFAAALRAGTDVRVIAEVKRRSPSQGDLAPTMDAGLQATAFAAGGAAAVSVLTEPSRFGGRLADLASARGAGLPMLRKDFIVDEIQLLEAAVHGAAAVLLIARALPPSHLAELHAAAHALQLDVLVEVHDAAELDQVLHAGYPIVGVNNRNLETLVIDVTTGEQLIPRIPRDRIAVFESGIHGPDDVRRAAAAGADAVLVGTSLSRHGSATDGVRELTGIARQTRAA